MAGRGTIDDDHDGDAGFGYRNAGYYLDGSTSCDPVVGSALGGAGGAGGGAYFEAVGPNSSAMDTATGGAGGTSTSGGAGGGSYIDGGYGGAGGTSYIRGGYG
jgi:hypothetical protein